MDSRNARIGDVPGGLAAFLHPEVWQQLAQLGVMVHFARRQILCRQGERGRHSYVLLSGVVKILRAERDGRQLMLTVRSAGDVVGDIAALEDRPRSATVAAVTPRLPAVTPPAVA